MHLVVPDATAAAWFDGMLATDVLDITHDPTALDSSGRWAVVVEFSGRVTALRFATWRPWPADRLPDHWRGPTRDSWTTSLDRDAYCEAVETIRRAIARGDVYQANLCRVLSAPLPRRSIDHDPFALLRRVIVGNPAPHAGAIRLPASLASAAVCGESVVTASPELFLRRHGQQVLSRPIKGTAATPNGFLPKDSAENLMIVDLVRNDLAQVAETGTVTVPEFLATEQHPGLAHLVSGVRATLRHDVGWAQILQSAFPPGSVTGAPKSTALQIIADLEPVARGPYCGAIGWVDADRSEAALAVGIRTFWITRGEVGGGSPTVGMPPNGETPPTAGALRQAATHHSAAGTLEQEGTTIHFGTGAGITWGSDPLTEWRETELKAARLVGLASEPSGRHP